LTLLVAERGVVNRDEGDMDKNAPRVGEEEKTA